MKVVEKFLQSKSFYYLFSILALVFIFGMYSKGYKAMLTDDGISGLWELQTQGVKGYFNSYDTEGLYYGHYAILSILYALFGLNPLGWFIVFASWYVLNTTLLFTVIKKLTAAFSINENGIWISLCSAFLFLISPYHSENIIWAATSHYAMCMTILLLLLNNLLDFSTHGQCKMSWWLNHVLFAFALFTLEISFLFPIVMLSLILLLKIGSKSYWNIKHYILKVALPQILFVVIYLGLYKLQFGRWIPHDRAGADVQVGIHHMVTTLTQHLMKLFGFVHQFDFKVREKIYGYALHWKISAAVLIVVFVFALVWLFVRNRKLFFVGLFTLFTGLLFYTPFVRVYFMYLVRFENDRYSFFASAFLLPFLVVFLFSLHKVIRIILFVAFSVLSIYFIFPSVKSKYESGRLHATYLKKFPQHIKGDIYLMNIPIYCNDSYMFRNKDRFPIAYQAYYGYDLFSKVKPILWYNAQTTKDTFAAKQINDTTFMFELKTNGSWLWHENIGASNYETNDYKVTLDEWGDYTLTLKHPLGKDDALLWFDGKGFRDLNTISSK